MACSLIHGLETSDAIRPWHSQIIDFLNDAFPERQHHSMADCHGTFETPYWVLIVWDTRIMALCAIGGDEFVYNVAVQKHHRREHFGLGLFQHVTQLFPHHKLRGFVKEDNWVARSFYKRMGVKCSPQRIKIDDAYHLEYVWSK